MDKGKNVINSDKKSKVLSIIGIIFLIAGIVLSMICLFEVVDAIIEENQAKLGLMIFLLISYNSAGFACSLMATILNSLAYKYAINMKKFKLTIKIVSFVTLFISILAFVLWYIGVKII